MEVEIRVVPPVIGDEDGMVLDPGDASPEPREEDGSSPRPPPPDTSRKGGGGGGPSARPVRTASVSESSNNNKGNISSGSNNKKPHRRGKQKGGKRHHRQWKPYFKMSWDEKKELEERETRRACQKRERRFASGQPMAPYNTTQFLMEQHEPSELAPGGGGGGGAAGGGCVKRTYNKSTEENGGSGSASNDPSSEDYYSSPDDEEIFLEKEFTEAYENYHAERLLTLNKDELVREYLELESKVEGLEKRSREQQQNGRLSSGGEEHKENGQQTKAGKVTNDRGVPQPWPSSEMTDLREEIRRLKEENENLRKDNEELRQSQIVTNSVNVGEP